MCWHCWMINFLWDYSEGVPGAVTLNCKASLRFLNCLVGILILLWHFFMRGWPSKGNQGVEELPRGYSGRVDGALCTDIFTHKKKQTKEKIAPTLYPKHVLLTLTFVCAYLCWRSLSSPVRRFSFPLLGPPDAGGRIKSAYQPKRKCIDTFQNKNIVVFVLFLFF